MILEPKPIPTNHWVSFALEGTPTNRLALNACIRVTIGTQQQLQEIRSGGHYLSQTICICTSASENPASSTG